MRKIAMGAIAAALVALTASPALAHVTVQPNEAVAGSFSRFVVRVPNEREDASTVKVEVKLPPLAFVSFEPKQGWQRDEKTGKLAEPVDAFGEEITEGVTSVIWSGGSIGPGEFAEFGFSVKMPDDPTTLGFKAIQTYSSGEVVRWNGAPDADQPAPVLATYDIGAGEGEGQLGVLARVSEEIASLQAAVEASEASEPEAETAPPAQEDDDEGDDDDGLGTVLGGAGLGLGAIALIVALMALKRKAPVA